ncbi:MAG: hypothetical protein ABR961_03180 [Thermoanaerobaculaceae bacterium]|jgi:hypothetical protein
MVTVVLILVALLAVLGGLMSLSQATIGVGIVALACFLAILARIAQAKEQHAELKRLLEQRTATPVP